MPLTVTPSGSQPAPTEPGPALRATAQALAAAARPIAQRYFRQKLAVEHKADHSPVTVADRAIETAMRSIITERHPEHAIYGEEHGVERLGARYTWVIDPIDGTKSFVTGLPLFGTLIALLEHGVPKLGLIDMPALHETWVGEAGEPTRFNNAPCRVSGCKNPAEAVLYATSPDMFEGAARAGFERVSNAVRLRRFGGDCYAYALLAAGYVDLVIEVGLQPYDYLPLVAVIEGAGGVVTDWNGQALRLGSDGRVVAAASPALHAWALGLINKS
ncbi:histidinol-phosphatase [Ferrovibrio sp.]|uniref:histidinol-phosphatase n=1 Tax=Ferrovibrio sp. TaxID=1917215 RepID=UPI003D2A610A